jgi:uncharacterized membrane protein
MKENDVQIIVLGTGVIVCYIILMMTIGFWATVALIGLGIVRKLSEDVELP